MVTEKATNNCSCMTVVVQAGCDELRRTVIHTRQVSFSVGGRVAYSNDTRSSSFATHHSPRSFE